jgi:hypothetical protein
MVGKSIKITGEMLVFHCFMQGEFESLIGGYLCIAVANGLMLTSGCSSTYCDGMSLLGSLHL